MQALIAQRRVRASITGQANKYEALCPTIRIPVIVPTPSKPTAVQEVPGGWTEANFTIPAAYRRHGLETMPHSALDLQVWIMDGLSHVFHGTIQKAIPNDQGDLEITCDGSYRLLGATRMRSIWADTDMGQLVQAPGSAGGASMTIDASGRLVFTFPRDQNFAAGAYIAADYSLFGEPVGTRDGKGLDSWKVSIGSASTFVNAANQEVRIYGMSSPSDPTPVLLQVWASGTSVPVTRTEVSTLNHGGDNSVAWPNAQYRCFRIGLYAASAISAPPLDHSAVITQFAVSTRGRHGVGLTGAYPTTSAIAADVFADGQSYDLHAYATEEHAATTGGAITSDITDSGQQAYGIAFPSWSTPQEIIEAMNALDGGICGMWGPTRNPSASSHVVTAGNTSVNYWPRQPASLTYKKWPDLSDPDYHVRLGRGAEWVADGQPDDLVSADYVGYSSLAGRPLTVFTEDTSPDNQVYEQGLHKAADYQITPAVDTQTAQTLGASYTNSRRQPSLSGTLTLYGDRPASWELPGGARGPRLFSFRPGVVRIVDAKGPKAGRITRLEYTARSASSPEMLVLTINSPAASLLDLQMARLARRAAHNRHR